MLGSLRFEAGAVQRGGSRHQRRERPKAALMQESRISERGFDSEPATICWNHFAHRDLVFGDALLMSWSVLKIQGSQLVFSQTIRFSILKKACKDVMHVPVAQHVPNNEQHLEQSG